MYNEYTYTCLTHTCTCMAHIHTLPHVWHTYLHMYNTHSYMFDTHVWHTLTYVQHTHLYMYETHTYDPHTLTHIEHTITHVCLTHLHVCDIPLRMCVTQRSTWNVVVPWWQQEGKWLSCPAANSPNDRWTKCFGIQNTRHKVFPCIRITKNVQCHRLITMPLWKKLYDVFRKIRKCKSHSYHIVSLYNLKRNRILSLKTREIEVITTKLHISLSYIYVYIHTYMN